MGDTDTHALDPSAPSTVAEYARYLDFDIVGKIITKNFLVNRLGYDPSMIHIPLGRYGDAKVKYKLGKKVVDDLTDGHVKTHQGSITFEVKCARLRVPNRSSGGSVDGWSFEGLLTSPSKSEKDFDLLVAIGVQVCGLEDGRYWKHVDLVHKNLQLAGRPSDIQAWPHEPAFLSICSFFIIPRSVIQHNHLSVMVKVLEKCKYRAYHAWGYDEDRCKFVWENALKTIGPKASIEL